MTRHNTNEQRKKEGDVHKGLPEATPNAGNTHDKNDHPAYDNPEDHGEIPRTRDDSKDHKHDPYQDK